MSIIGQVGGKELSSDMQKVFDYLKKLLADGKKLDLSIDEIKKKAGVPNANNATVSGLIIREQNDGNFKNLTIKRYARGAEAGKSKYDADYKNNKKFRDFYNETYKTPWNEIDQKTNLKDNSYKAFLNKQRLEKVAKGFTLTTEEMAKKLGITLQSLRTYEAKPEMNTSSIFVKNNIKKIRTVGVNPTTGLRETVVRYKDPGKNIFKNWNTLQSSPKISGAMISNIKEYDKVFRDEIKLNKKIPEISKVIKRTSMKTPSTIANTEALYSRLLRGETFRSDVGIARDAVLGKRIIEELSIDGSNNARRSAFYRLALDIVNKKYPGQSGDLETFKTNFRRELRKTLGLKKGQTVPFSINEVIGLSTGQSRGVQPFSVFVDAVETDINKLELRNYQGQFSKKLKKVQKLLSGNKPNIAEATRIAGLLKGDRKTLVDALTKKGFTTNQINQLNIPDIKVSKTIDPKHFTPEKLARWKEQTKGALDIEQFVKDKGYYIDIKKGKPFWESKVKDFMINAAKSNKGGVCGIFKGRIAYSADGGRIGFAAGSNCAREMEIALATDSKGTLQQITKTEGIIPKVKNAARGFLGALGKVGVKAAPWAALAVAGAAIEPVVKQFMNDDPSTYLTDPDQQAGMLEALIEGETPKVDQEILNWQYPGLAAATAAGAIPGAREVYRDRLTGRGPAGPAGTRLPATIPNKPVGPLRSALGFKGVLGKALGATFSPLAVAATLPIHVAAQRKGGTEWGDIATDPMNWMAPAFASSGAEFATKGMKPTGILAKAIRMGISPSVLRTVSSRFGMPGLLLTGGMWGYDKWKNRSINDED